MLETQRRKKLVVVSANDNHTIEAVSKAVDLDIVEGILIGDTDTMKRVCKEENIDFAKFTIVHEPDSQKAANLAVKMINDGDGEILMKGLISSDKYMRAILNKECGLLHRKSILSHVVVMEIANYPKLLVVSDAAVIPAPDLSQKIAMTNNVIYTAKALGVETPRVALIAATEQIMPNMQACVDGSIIAKMSERGQIVGALVDGPLALDVALDPESVKIKKLKSVVDGQADCLVFPNIESANVFYKTVSNFCEAQLGAILAGAKCPAVLSSRGDSAETKANSIALAALSVK